MNELIKITTNSQGEQIVSARDLYNALGIKRDFTTWCNKMFSYGFQEDKDFTPVWGESSGGRPSVDYAMTIDTAKEISMVQRSEKGKALRLYFIECEKKLRVIQQSNIPTVPMSPLDVMQLAIDQMRIQETRLSTAEEKIEELEIRTSTRPDYFTIVGYAVYKRKKVPLSLAKDIGQKAKRICSQQGYMIDSVPDPRFGKVNQYPRQVLEQVFNDLRV